MSASWSVRLQDVSKRFGNFAALKSVSFEFGPGEIFGFIGPNGAGKTTTLRILSTLEEPDSGDLWIGDDSVLEVPDRVRRRLGFVPDKQGVYAQLTVAEYIDFFARAYSLRGEARRRTVREIIEFAGLVELAERDCSVLSKGMRQRLSFARALVHDPDLLILDEPMEGLDPRARIEFRELLIELAGRGKAILISSHILTELSSFVTRVGIIERGKIVACGSVEDLARDLRSASLVRLRLREDQDAAAVERFLVQVPGVLKVEFRGADLTVELDGQEPEGDRLVHALFGAGYRVESFRCEEPDLEDVFLSLTRGDVA